MSTQKFSQTNTVTKEEEQISCYVAGYIPFDLHTKFKDQLNETAQTFCKFLKSWKVCCSKTFLEYTNQWISAE